MPKADKQKAEADAKQMTPPKNMHSKMYSCKHYRCFEILLDYCDYWHQEYPCDAPTDYPLWKECKDCKFWEPKEEMNKGKTAKR